MPRQKSGAAPSKEMEQQGQEGTAPAKKKTQDAQRPDESPPNRDAQRKPQENLPNQDAQRKPQEPSSTQGAQRQGEPSGGQDAQRSKTETEQRTGSKQGSGVETTGSVDISAEKRTTIRETITRSM
jgi:hypothetical protein